MKLADPSLRLTGAAPTSRLLHDLTPRPSLAGCSRSGLAPGGESVIHSPSLASTSGT